MTESDGGIEKMQQVREWRTSPVFSPMERVALEYAERVTFTDQRPDDALFARLREHFDDAQMVELTAAIALENFRSKFNPSLGVEGQGFCVIGAKQA